MGITLGVREETGDVLGDIDSVLADTHKTITRHRVWDGLFAGWNDDDNEHYADTWVAWHLVNADSEAELMMMQRMDALRDTFTGPQNVDLSMACETVTIIDRESLIFTAMEVWGTPRNMDALDYMSEIGLESPSLPPVPSILTPALDLP